MTISIIVDDLRKEEIVLSMRLESVRNAINSLTPSSMERVDIDAIVNECLNILIQNGRPMRRKDIFMKLKERGMSVLGKDRVKNLGTILWRRKDLFFHIHSLGYWVAKDFEENKYDNQRNSNNQ